MLHPPPPPALCPGALSWAQGRSPSVPSLHSVHSCFAVRITLGCACVFLDESNYILINTWQLCFLSSADLPASALQYQCGPVDYPCSPQLAKKGPTPRPCHDRPAIKPRPQPSSSPRPQTAQKPQGKTPGHSVPPPFKAGFDIGAVIIIERCNKIRPLGSSCHLFCSDKHFSITWCVSADWPHSVTHTAQ